MIISRTNGKLIMVEQIDHARLAGGLARRWGNEQFERPEPFESVCLAADKHDEGWASPDRVPLYSDDLRRPLSFLEIDLRKHAAFYGAGVTEVEAADTYAALLCSMHWTGLYCGRYGTAFGMIRKDLDEETQTFLNSVIREQEQRWVDMKAELWPWERARSEFELEVWTNYELLQTWDVLSLFVCMIRDQDFERSRVVGPVPESKFGARLELKVHLREDRTAFEIDPFPFDGPFSIGVRTLELPDQEYRTLDALREVMTSAPEGRLDVKILPVS